jgi:outer membrane lipoprotein SlyB
MLLAACTPQPSPSSFAAGETMRAVPMQWGTVEDVRAVEIRPGQTRIGAIAGALLGGVAGSQIGRSTAANVAGATAGAVAGGATGSAIQGSSRTAGVELFIELASGDMIAVVQPGDVRDFREGDRVRVTGHGDNVRVTR